MYSYDNDRAHLNPVTIENISLIFIYTSCLFFSLDLGTGFKYLLRNGSYLRLLFKFNEGLVLSAWAPFGSPDQLSC